MKRNNEGHTFPTNNCVLVSLGGADLASGEGRAEVAIWMTASISSFVGGIDGGLGDFEMEDALDNESCTVQLEQSTLKKKRRHVRH